MAPSPSCHVTSATRCCASRRTRTALYFSSFLLLPALPTHQKKENPPTTEIQLHKDTCEECGARLFKVDFHKDKNPLPSKASTLHEGCLFCDPILSKLGKAAQYVFIEVVFLNKKQLL